MNRLRKQTPENTGKPATHLPQEGEIPVEGIPGPMEAAAVEEQKIGRNAITASMSSGKALQLLKKHGFGRYKKVNP